MNTAHIDSCTQGEDEYHMGPDRCPACDEDMQAQYEAEAYAEFGMGWVASGGDPADVRLAWSQEKALRAEAERDEDEDEEIFEGWHEGEIDLANVRL